MSPPTSCFSPRTTDRFPFGVAAQTVVKRLQHIFSPGIQSKFHAHYSAAQRLLTALEDEIGTAKELEHFRTSDVMQQWNSKWLFSVYAVPGSVGCFLAGGE